MGKVVKQIGIKILTRISRKKNCFHISGVKCQIVTMKRLQILQLCSYFLVILITDFILRRLENFKTLSFDLTSTIWSYFRCCSAFPLTVKQFSNHSIKIAFDMSFLFRPVLRVPDYVSQGNRLLGERFTLPTKTCPSSKYTADLAKCSITSLSDSNKVKRKAKTIESHVPSRKAKGKEAYTQTEKSSRRVNRMNSYFFQKQVSFSYHY